MQRDSPLVLHGDNPLQFGDKLEGKSRWCLGARMGRKGKRGERKAGEKETRWKDWYIFNVVCTGQFKLFFFNVRE